MVNSELSLEVSSTCSSKVMRVYDTSLYCKDADTSNYLVEVLPVMKSSWIQFPVQQGFSLVLNSSNLQYKKVSDSEGLIELPDGIYEFRQSHKPNIQTLVQFYHLRVCALRGKVAAEWDKLLSGKCDISREEFYQNRDKLREIDEYILAAKHIVEDCSSKKEGLEMYDFATKLLEQYDYKCKCK